MNFITSLTHSYLGYSQVGNIKYQVTKRVIVISMTNFLQIILNLIAYRFIAQYHTNSRFDKCIKNRINVPLNRIYHFLLHWMRVLFILWLKLHIAAVVDLLHYPEVAELG